MISQIDTTLKEFYPLKIGNVWQYQHVDPFGVQYISTCRIAGDTILPDGERYYQGCGLVRIDSLLHVWQNYGGVATDTTQECQMAYSFNVYRLNEQVGTIWGTCQNLVATLCYPWFMRYDGIYTSNIFGQTREVMRFTPGAICPETGDTTWYYVDWLLVRGIGIYREETIETAARQLIGAIINGVKYGTLVGVDENSLMIPTSFHLMQNYPNPFNTSTMITYEIPRETFVTLEVYDMLGRKVAQLVNRTKQPGHYQEVFDASMLSSGVYIYRLRAGEFNKTNVMILIK